MRYGKPPIAERLIALQAAGCDRILVVPLYPQYCAATTATVADKAFDALKTMRWQPSLRIAPPWHDDPVYIGALARSVQEGLGRLDFEPEVVLACSTASRSATLKRAIRIIASAPRRRGCFAKSSAGNRSGSA